MAECNRSQHLDEHNALLQIQDLLRAPSANFWVKGADGLCAFFLSWLAPWSHLLVLREEEAELKRTSGKFCILFQGCLFYNGTCSSEGGQNVLVPGLYESGVLAEPELCSRSSWRGLSLETWEWMKPWEWQCLWAMSLRRPPSTELPFAHVHTHTEGKLKSGFHVACLPTIFTSEIGKQSHIHRMDIRDYFQKEDSMVWG